MTVEADENVTAQAEVNGVRYKYKTGGTPGAPWITFAHALANNLSLWDDVAAKLGGRYRTLQFDHPGHGGTPAVPGPYNFDMLIENAVGLWDALGIEASHWAGLSIGGMMGYGLAARHPERVLSLIACDARPDAPPDYADYFQYRIDTAREKGMAGLVEPSIERWFTPQSVAANPPALDKVRAMVRATDPVGHAGCCEALKGLSFGPELASISVPTLVLGGEADKGAPADVLAAATAQIPGAKHAVIPDAGHISVLENPEAVQAVVEKFLAGL